MKVNRFKLIDMLNNLKLSGEIETKSLYIDIKNTCIESLIATSNKVLAIRATYKNDGENIGKVGFFDVDIVKNILNNFTSPEVDIKEKDGSLLISEGKTKATVKLTNIDYITSKIEVDKFETLKKKAYKNTFSLTKEQIKKIIDITNSLKSNVVNISSENGESVVVSVENNENTISTEIDLTTKIQPFNCSFSYFFITLLSILNANSINISITSNNPAFIEYSNGDNYIEYVVAPFIVK